MSEIDIRKLRLSPEYMKLKNRYEQLMLRLEYCEQNFIECEAEIPQLKRTIRRTDGKIETQMRKILFNKNKN
jgi:hypothetical protein